MSQVWTTLKQLAVPLTVTSSKWYSEQGTVMVRQTES